VKAAPALFGLLALLLWEGGVRLGGMPSHVLPGLRAGLQVSGGLALVGAAVAEFVAGAGGFASGLAHRILEAGYRLQIPRMFAALVLLSVAGIAINAALGGVRRPGAAAAVRLEGGAGYRQNRRRSAEHDERWPIPRP